MRRRRIAGDDQVEIAHDRRGVFKIAQSIPQVRDLAGKRGAGQLLAAQPLLQAVEPQTVERDEWRERRERNRAIAIQLVARIALPGDADFQAPITGRTGSLSAKVGSMVRGVDAAAALVTINQTKPIWVTFGDSRDYDYKIASLYVLLEQAKEMDLALNAVDLRFGDRLSFN